MRKLIIARGHPGSGKSHTLREAGLTHWTLSSDAIRSTIAAPFLTSDGRMIVSQEFNDIVFPRLFAQAEERMARGETLAIDTTLYERSDMKRWITLAKRYRYRIAVLDMSTTPLETAIARNWKRDEYTAVPPYRVQQMYEQIIGTPIGELPPHGAVIKGKPDGSHVGELVAWLREPVLDLSSYREVVHIGDIQGCFSVLAGTGGPLASGFRDDTFYIFVGDLLDRGIENGSVMRWFIDNAIGHDNVALLWGNHEDHLARWAAHEEAVSLEFEKRTLPQLIDAGVRPTDAGRVCDMARDFLQYRYRGAEVLVTHAGLSTYPRDPHLVSLRQFSHGTGFWSDPVDEQFERNSDAGIQVHGHRNHGGVPVQASPRSFNLEDSVEFGGNLRTCTLSASGWTTAEYPNRVFRSRRDRLALDKVERPGRIMDEKLIPHWMLEGPSGGTQFDEGLLAAMQAHEGINDRANERFPHVRSLNFTKRVFFDKAWDDIVVKARGLFYVPETREIVARGYEKFWNINEREETTLEALGGTLKFPVRGYAKENGFLGNLGYDAQTDALYVASKSTPDGNFAGWFRDILDATLDAGQQERLRRYLRDNEASMTFEVIDPVNDPHMIAYPAPKLVLLDVLRRSTEFEKASFEVVQAVGERFGIETKRAVLFLKNFEAFAGYVGRAKSDFDIKVDGEYAEGIVFEDAAGYMVKVKHPFYAFWKQMRGQKDRIVSCRGKGTPYAFRGLKSHEGEPAADGMIELAQTFIAWCEEQDTEILKLDIATLRSRFEERKPVETRAMAV